VSFGRPEAFWLLLPMFLLVVWLVRSRRWRSQSWRTLAQRGWPPHLRTASMLAAAVLLIAAMARPRFGLSLGSPLPPGQDLVLLVDVSRSMAAEDAVPSRLTVAAQAGETLIDAMGADPANRVGVAVFAGRGVLRYPLTENLGAVTDILSKLRPGSVQPGGTDLGAGLDAALDAFGTEEHAEGRAIVLFSDGEDHADRWKSRLDRLERMGVMVHVVEIGDAGEGHPVPSGTGERPLTYEGEPVRSRRVDTALEAIARQTDGAIVKLGLASSDLGVLYRERIAPMARLKREASRSAERPEQFPTFLAAALGFVISGCWPAGRVSPWRWIWNRAAPVLLMTALAVGGLAGANRTDRDRADLAALVAEGRSHYAAGRWAEALAAFESASQGAGEQPLLRYNEAAALYQLGRFSEALERYQSVREKAGAALRTKTDYALGNCALSLGDLSAAVEHYDRCLASTATGPDLDDVRRDAELNRQFALERAASTLGASGDSDRGSSSQEPRKRPPSRRKSPNDDEDSQAEDRSGPGQEPGGNQPQNGGDNRPRRNRSRSGGGGGASRNAGNQGDTPDDRLDSALDEIRDAQRRRLPEETTDEPAGDTRKDW
jgi:Ca-activated chloride channel family protein